MIFGRLPATVCWLHAVAQPLAAAHAQHRVGIYLKLSTDLQVNSIIATGLCFCDREDFPL